MYCVIFEGYGSGYACLASYGETLDKACWGLEEFCSESISICDEDELYDISDYEKLRKEQCDEEFVSSFQIRIGDGDISVILLVNTDDVDAKEKLIEFIEEGPVDLYEYYSEDDDLEEINLYNDLNNLPVFFEHLQEILEKKYFGS